jgi:hypothetical protein
VIFRENPKTIGEGLFRVMSRRGLDERKTGHWLEGVRRDHQIWKPRTNSACEIVP